MSGIASVVVIIVAVVLIAVVGLLLVRRLVPPARLAQHTDVAGYVYAVIGVVYAVILAQVVIAAWDEYRDAERVAAAEANTVLNLGRLAQLWPERSRVEIEAALAEYARHVIDVEWPAMAAGDYEPATHFAVVHELWRLVNAASQEGGSGNPSFAAAFTQLSALDDARRNRVLLGQGGLPEAMTLTLLLGAVVTVSFSYLFAVDDGWVHGLMTASLATLVALLLLLEYQLDTPFEGISAIEPAAMEFALGEVEAGIGRTGGAP